MSMQEGEGATMDITGSRVQQAGLGLQDIMAGKAAAGEWVALVIKNAILL